MSSDYAKSKTALGSGEHSDVPAKREYGKPVLSRKSYQKPVLSRLSIDETETGVNVGSEMLVLLS